MTNMTFQEFQEKFNKLKQRYPRPPTHSLSNENSDYGDYLFRCKNAFFSFDTADSADICYIFDSFKTTDCIDGDYVVESEKLYECVDSFKAYNSTYLNYCARIYDSHFCFDCNDSNNLFGCVYLNHKQYCIFNKQYKKEEYEKKVQELIKKPPEEHIKKMKILMQKFPVTTTQISHAENCEYGNHIHYCKNLYLCFDCAHSEDCAYLYDSHRNKNCFDLTQTFSSEFSYECQGCDKLNNCFYMDDCGHMFDSAFCQECSNSNHLFGCVALTKIEYCILNKQYTKEEYEKEVREIVESFKQQASII